MTKRLFAIVAIAWHPLIASADPLTFHQGVTVEADAGTGFMHSAADGFSDNGPLSVALAAGVGDWLDPHVALTLRATLQPRPPVPLQPDGILRSDNLGWVFMFVGPSLQVWIDDHVWLGGGLGLALAHVQQGILERGWGLDLRAGYMFARQAATAFDISLEVTPAYYSIGGGITGLSPMSSTATGVTLLVGYQFL